MLIIYYFVINPNWGSNSIIIIFAFSKIGLMLKGKGFTPMGAGCVL